METEFPEIWLKVAAPNHTIYAKAIEQYKHGGLKCVSVVQYSDGTITSAKIHSSMQWYPVPVTIFKKEIPEKILKKIEKYLDKK